MRARRWIKRAEEMLGKIEDPSRKRPGIMSVRIMASPEKIAPATKYGAKIVLCQPGTTATAKSHETMLCTDTTSAVMSPASTAYAARKWRHSSAVPVHPSASRPKIHRRHPVA